VISHKLRLRLLLHTSLLGLFALERSRIIMVQVLAPLKKEKKINR
jgi:hypothetical protein